MTLLINEVMTFTPIVSGISTATCWVSLTMHKVTSIVVLQCDTILAFTQVLSWTDVPIFYVVVMNETVNLFIILVIPLTFSFNVH